MLPGSLIFISDFNSVKCEDNRKICAECMDGINVRMDCWHTVIQPYASIQCSVASSELHFNVQYRRAHLSPSICTFRC